SPLASKSQVPTFRSTASLASSGHLSCRMPLRPYTGFAGADPAVTTPLRFRHRPYAFDTSIVVPLRSSSCLTPDLVLARPFPSAFTTLDFVQSRRRWFGTCSCKPIPRGRPSSVKQLRATRPYDHSRSWHTIVRVPRKPKLASLQLAIEFVEHEVTEQGRQRSALRRPFVHRTHQPIFHHSSP